MNVNTDLADVARILPASAAELLMYTDPVIQTAVLTMVRGVIAEWEESGVCLDPITLETVLTSVVKHFIGLSNLVVELLEERK